MMESSTVIEVSYGNVKTDKPGVTYADKWRVMAYRGDLEGNRFSREKGLKRIFDKKKPAVNEARKIARKHSNPRRAVVLKVLTKSGEVSEKTRYGRG